MPRAIWTGWARAGSCSACSAMRRGPRTWARPCSACRPPDTRPYRHRHPYIEQRRYPTSPRRIGGAEMANAEQDLSSLLGLAPVIPVVVIDDEAAAVPMARALVAGGLPVIEVTLRTPAGLSAIKR